MVIKNNDVDRKSSLSKVFGVNELKSGIRFWVGHLSEPESDSKIGLSARLFLIPVPRVWHRSGSDTAYSLQGILVEDEMGHETTSNLYWKN